MKKASRKDENALKLEYGRLSAQNVRDGEGFDPTRNNARMQEIREELKMSHEEIISQLPTLTLPISR